MLWANGRPVTVPRVDIALSDGRRILVEGATALSGGCAAGHVSVAMIPVPSNTRMCGAGCWRHGHAAWLQPAGRAGRTAFWPKIHTPATCPSSGVAGMIFVDHWWDSQWA